MKITYRLSMRQRKELLVRGVAIRIAIPAPDYEVTDPMQFARESLADDIGEHVTHAEETEIRVDPTAGSDGVASLIGKIETRPDIWTVGVAAVICTLSIGRPRGDRAKIQWPAEVLVDGAKIFEREGAGR